MLINILVTLNGCSFTYDHLNKRRLPNEKRIIHVEQARVLLSRCSPRQSAANYLILKLKSNQRLPKKLRDSLNEEQTLCFQNNEGMRYRNLLVRSLAHTYFYYRESNQNDKDLRRHVLAKHPYPVSRIPTQGTFEWELLGHQERMLRCDDIECEVIIENFYYEYHEYSEFKKLFNHIEYIALIPLTIAADLVTLPFQELPYYE